MAAGTGFPWTVERDCTVFRDTRPWDKSGLVQLALGSLALAGLQPFRGGVLLAVCPPRGPHTEV